MNKIMDGRLVRDTRKEELKKEITKLKEKLTLVVISVGEDPASKVYVHEKEKMACDVGYQFINMHFDDIEEDKLIKEIEKLNNDVNINGIIVQLPLPKTLNKNKILNTISPLKDVDGLTDLNFIKLIRKEKGLIPCTPKGILSILDYYKVDLSKKVVIVGRSELVGLPLFHLLLNRNATVTLCHSKTKDLKSYTKDADILIVAVGKKELISRDMVKDGSIIVDVGINRENGKLYGDVENSSLEVASFMTPVPGGVGPMTVISLMENVLEAYLLQKKN